MHQLLGIILHALLEADAQADVPQVPPTTFLSADLLHTPTNCPIAHPPIYRP